MLTAAKQITSAAAPKGASPLTLIQKAGLSYAHNFHHPHIYFGNGVKKTFDYNIDYYAPHIRAFLTKRWTARREIPPKISVLKDMGPSYRQVYF